MASVPKVGDGTPDAALAIGEDAFRAGFAAAWQLWSKVYPAQPQGEAAAASRAWSEYDPPEHIKALS
jgi:hypothetical protein